jgi:hypothetical protein
MHATIRRVIQFSNLALVGFQGRGCADGIQPDLCHFLFLRSPYFSIILKVSHDSQTTLEHKTPESNKSVAIKEVPKMVVSYLQGQR